MPAAERNQSTIVLFPHPRAEHASTRHGSLYPWNRKGHDHWRKFLVAPVASATRDDKGNWRATKNLSNAALWTEYEPPTRIEAFSDAWAPGLPEAWHTFVPVEQPPAFAQNTDPWIFGRWFRYVICKQERNRFLQELRPGDVIFFGSWMKRDVEGNPAITFNFFMDTVFVVGEAYRDHLGEHGSIAPPEMRDPIYDLCVWNRVRADELKTFYRGRMLQDARVEETFCWTPCATAPPSAPPPRFRRPMIGQLFGKTCGHGQAIIRVEDCTPSEAWTRVVDHCVQVGLKLAVQVSQPQLATNRHPDSTVYPGSCR